MNTLELTGGHAEASEPPPQAPPLALERPAGEFLDAVPWDGVAPDPDELDAATFLGLL